MTRSPAITAGLAAVLCLFLVAARAQGASAGSHPYFDDKGTLVWYTDLDAAAAAARASGRVLFVEYGRRECGNCRILVQTVLPSDGLKGRFGAACVGLAADCDAPDPRVESLFRRNLPGATLLPFVGFVSPDGGWIAGWSGGGDAVSCARALDRAAPYCRRPTAEALVPAVARRTEASPVTAPSAVVGPAQAVARAAAREIAPTPTGIAVAPSAPAPRAETARPATAPVPPIAPSPAIRASAPAKPAVVAGPLPVAPSAPSRPRLEGLPTPTQEGQALLLLALAEKADQEGRPGEVLRLDAAAAALPVRVDPQAWSRLVGHAKEWTDTQVRAATAAARAQRPDEAARILSLLRQEMNGGPGAREVEQGERALERVRALVGTTPLDRERAMAGARDEFRGSPWALMFEP